MSNLQYTFKCEKCKEICTRVYKQEPDIYIRSFDCPNCLKISLWQGNVIQVIELFSPTLDSDLLASAIILAQFVDNIGAEGNYSIEDLAESAANHVKALKEALKEIDK